MTFRQFLELKFLQWQQESGGRRTVLEFAKYLGVSQQTVSSWWNQTRQPEGANVQKLAKKLGLEVYDVLNLPRWLAQTDPAEVNRALHLLLDSIVVGGEKIELKFK